MPCIAVYGSDGDRTTATGCAGYNRTKDVGAVECGGAEYYYVDTSEVVASQGLGCTTWMTFKVPYRGPDMSVRPGPYCTVVTCYVGYRSR